MILQIVSTCQPACRVSLSTACDSRQIDWQASYWVTWAAEKRDQYSYTATALSASRQRLWAWRVVAWSDIKPWHTLYKRLRRMSELHALVRYIAVMFYNDLSFVPTQLKSIKSPNTFTHQRKTFLSKKLTAK